MNVSFFLSNKPENELHYSENVVVIFYVCNFVRLIGKYICEEIFELCTSIHNPFAKSDLKHDSGAC